MRKRMMMVAAAIACMAVATALPGMAETAPKPLTPQQQKMKDCGAEWQKMKADGTAKGMKWADFRKDCLKKK